MPKKIRKMKKTNTQKPPQAQTQVPEVPKVNAADILKDRLKSANKGGLLGVLGQIKNTTPDQWKDADTVRDLAKKLATQFKVPINEQRLDQFSKAFKDATKGGNPQDPDQLLKKYGNNIDPKSVDEFKKFMK